jgi:hypothetical protein
VEVQFQTGSSFQSPSLPLVQQRTKYKTSAFTPLRSKASDGVDIRVCLLHFQVKERVYCQDCGRDSALHCGWTRHALITVKHPSPRTSSSEQGPYVTFCSFGITITFLAVLVLVCCLLFFDISNGHKTLG